jgi:hypothetical protein
MKMCCAWHKNQEKPLDNLAQRVAWLRALCALQHLEQAQAAFPQTLALEIPASESRTYLSDFTPVMTAFFGLLVKELKLKEAQEALTAWLAQLDRHQAALYKEPGPKPPRKATVNTRSTANKLRAEIQAEQSK